MSNRVNAHETRQVERSCTCEGKPHDVDTADVRTALGYGELAQYRAAGWERSGGRYFLVEDAIAEVVALGTVRWNLVLPDGSARDISADEVALLDEGTVDWLYQAIKPATQPAKLPNVSGAPSANGSRGSASRTRTTKTQPPSTST